MTARTAPGAEPAWTATDGPPALGPGQVHAWRFGLDLPPDRLDELERTLAADERARADRFRGPRLRGRFVAGRGLLRSLLAGYLGRSPDAIRFAYGPQGKPSLVDGEGLHFNLSHSRGRGLLAVASSPVGIDLELRREGEGPDPLRIADRFFAPEERLALHRAAPEDRHRLFLTIWVRKEAFLKATGRGLSDALDRFSILDDPLGGPPRLSAPSDPERGGRWSVRDLDPGPDAVAAVVVEGRAMGLSLWEPRACPWGASDQERMRA